MRRKQYWDYALVSVVDESPWVEEALWEHGDDGFELVTAYHKDGCVQLYFKKPMARPDTTASREEKE